MPHGYWTLVSNTGAGKKWNDVLKPTYKLRKNISGSGRSHQDFLPKNFPRKYLKIGAIK